MPDRRGLWLAGAAALTPSALTHSVAAQDINAPSAAVTQPATAAKARGAKTAVPFAPPAGPIILTHTLRRMLHDGQQIVVTRRYAVQFVPDGSGFTLSGRLIEATVDAPPAVALLADLERNRPDNLLPLRLDHAGQIQDQPAAHDPATNRAATAAALQLVAGASIALEAKQQSAALIGQLAAAPGNLSALPVDVFAPLRAEQRDEQKLALPGGRTGTVAISTRVDGWRAGSLPRSVERTITTVIGDSSRTSSELWSFTAE